jgi:hypothetical protein
MSGTIYRPEEKHPQPWQDDLNPNAGAGLNHGLQGQADIEKTHLRTMHDVKDLHRKFHDWNDADLKQVPILPEGARLQADATYVNLRDRVPTERHASGEETAGPYDFWVPKSETPYELWNRLVQDRPE